MAENFETKDKWSVVVLFALIVLAPSAFGSNWDVSESTSPMDDSRRVILTNESKERFLNSYGRLGHTKLLLRCIEGRTTFLLNLNDEFLSERDGYGSVDFRLDSEPMFTRPMTVSTDNKYLGFWRSMAMPAITDLFGHSTLTVRATPYNQASITASFNIDGIEDSIQPLREACNWQ